MANLSSVNLPYIGDGQFIRSATAKVTKNGVDYERQIVVLGDPDNPDSVLSLANGGLPVSATNLDIRNLSDTRDSVRVTNTVSVNATDLDIRNLSSSQDSVTVSGSVNVGNFPATQTVAGTVTANLGTLNGAATAANQTTTNTTLSSLDNKTPDESGVWGYNAGVSGTLNVAANKRVLTITATSAALAGATMTINGGQTIVIPPGASITITPKANLVAPTIVFTTTVSYFVEFVE